MATVARLKTDSKRAEIIEMRFKGHTLQQVGDKLGMTLQGVKYHEDAWLAAQRPSSEVTEARRQMQLASIDALRMSLFAALEDELETSTRLAVVDRIAKLWEREAKLVGLDLERGISVTLLTRESLAAGLGWDPSVIDAEATEITSGDDAT